MVVGRPLPLLPDGQRRCRNMASPRSVDFEGGTLSMFAGSLGMVLDRPVIDKTGITRYFEMHLVFSPDDSAAPRPVADDPGASAAVTSPDAPGIFQAIQEQLGLRLVPAKGPVDVLVIDHIERPSENCYDRRTLALDIESHILLQLGDVSMVTWHVAPTGHRSRPFRAFDARLVQSRLSSHGARMSDGQRLSRPSTLLP